MFEDSIIKKELKHSVFTAFKPFSKWSARRDLNSRSLESESSALATVLRAGINISPAAGGNKTYVIFELSVF